MFDNLPVFSELPFADRNILSLFCQERRISKGEMLLNEHEEGMAVYILKQGKLRIFKTIHGTEQNINTITEYGTIL